MSRENEHLKALYTGCILALVADTDIDEIICLRVRDDNGRYPTITYREALYSQLNEQHVGLYVLAVSEITLEELQAPMHAAVWEQYRRERRDEDGSALAATAEHGARRLFLHVLEGGVERLIVAQDLEIRFEQDEPARYWELGYRYEDVCCEPGDDSSCENLQV